MAQSLSRFLAVVLRDIARSSIAAYWPQLHARCDSFPAASALSWPTWLIREAWGGPGMVLGPGRWFWSPPPPWKLGLYWEKSCPHSSCFQSCSCSGHWGWHLQDFCVLPLRLWGCGVRDVQCLEKHWSSHCILPLWGQGALPVDNISCVSWIGKRLSKDSFPLMFCGSWSLLTTEEPCLGRSRPHHLHQA